MPAVTTTETMDNIEVDVRLLKQVTVISGQTLVKGEVVQQTGNRTAGTVTADAGNTGDGAPTAATVSDNAVTGTYVLECTAAAADAGTFKLVDPNGAVLDANITVGVAYTGVISLTIADGATDFIIGDKFTVLVTPAAGKVTSFTTGSEPYSVMAQAVDASGGDVVGYAYREATLKSTELDFGTGTDAEVRDRLDMRNIKIVD